MESRVKLAIDQLRVGHFVVLSGPWSAHPFLRSRFLLKSERDLKRLRESGLREVEVEPARSLPDRPAAASSWRLDDDPPLAGPSVPAEPAIPAEWDSDALVSAEFLELVRSSHLPAPEKARRVHSAAVDLMTDLMRHPSLARVQEFKAGVAGLVDQVLRDRALADGLLRITAHDAYTWTHSVNVGVLSLLLARSLYRHSDAHDLHELAAGFFLHDLGKSRIDPRLLNKRGRFTEEERAVMRTHVTLGEELVAETGSLSGEVVCVVGQHHEHGSGTGYPRGLDGEAIHPYARICGLVDVYDALTALRPYKVSLSPVEALRTIRREIVTPHNQAHFEELARVLLG